MAKKIVRRRGFNPSITELENRTLLTGLYAEWVVDGSITRDMTGPSLGVGPDGLVDDVLKLHGLDVNKQLAGVKITDLTSGGVWGYGVDPAPITSLTAIEVAIGAGSIAIERDGNGSQSFAPYPASSTDAVVYLNPTTYLIDPTKQSSNNVQYNPSTNTPTTTRFSLQNGDQLKVILAYWNPFAKPSDQTAPTPYYSTLEVNDLNGSHIVVSAARPTVPSSDTTSPAIILNTHVPVNTSWVQNDSPYLGWVHFTVPGVLSSTATTTTVVQGALLTDEAGNAWGMGDYNTSDSAKTDATRFGPLTVNTIANGNDIDCVFPPTRNEQGSTMTLRLLTKVTTMTMPIVRSCRKITLSIY